jgi:hypothetical protein
MGKYFRTTARVAGAALFLWLLFHGTYFAVRTLVAMSEHFSASGSPFLRYVAGALGFLLLYGIPAVFLWQKKTGKSYSVVFSALLAVESLVLVAIWAMPEPPPRFCTSCDYIVGDIDLSAKKMTDAQLTQEFGSGCTVNIEGWPEARSYSFPKAEVAMLISRERIKISHVGTRPTSCKAARELKFYGTSRGVNLGDSVQKVTRVYGQPNEFYTAMPGRPELIYRMPWKSMSFQIVDEKVESIDIQVMSH